MTRSLQLPSQLNTRQNRRKVKALFIAPENIRLAHGRVGKPPIFPDNNSFSQAIVEYFALCEKLEQIPNKAGLRLFLAMSIDTYSEYKERYPDTLKIAEHVIENAWIQRLATPASVGAIFYLKNAFKDDYKDRRETDITSGGDKISGIEYIVPVIPKKLLHEAQTTTQPEATPGLAIAGGQDNN